MSKRTIILLVVLVVVWGFAIIYLINYLKPKPVQPVQSQVQVSQTTSAQQTVQQGVISFDEIKRRLEEFGNMQENAKESLKASLKPYVLILTEELLITNSPIEATTDQFYYLGHLKFGDENKVYVSKDGKEEYFYGNELYDGRYRLLSIKPTYIIMFDLSEGNIKKLSYKIQ